MRRRRSIVGGGVLALSLLAGACGSSQSGKSAPTTTAGATSGTSACGLLTADEVSAVLGLAVTGTSLDKNGIRACQFKSAAQPDSGALVVEVFAGDPAVFASALQQLPVTNVPVAGLGDQAAYGTGAGVITVLTGKQILLIIDEHADKSYGSQQELTDLAKKALSRLPSIS